MVTKTIRQGEFYHKYITAVVTSIFWVYCYFLLTFSPVCCLRYLAIRMATPTSSKAHNTTGSIHGPNVWTPAIRAP